jgi:hypothetical protein
LHPQDFIKVLPDDILTNSTPKNQQIVCGSIEQLIRTNQFARPKIAAYAQDNFDFSQIIKSYGRSVDEFINF